MFRKITDEQSAHRHLVTIRLDGELIEVEGGEPIAAILLRVPPFFSRKTPISGQARAPFCLMGACFECLVEIDGATSVRSCLVRAQPGMTIKRQDGRSKPIQVASRD